MMPLLGRESLIVPHKNLSASSSWATLGDKLLYERNISYRFGAFVEYL